MVKYIIKRLLLTIPVMLGAIIIIFTITYFTPGDPAYIVLGASASDAEVLEWRHSVGLDRPFIEQLITYLAQIITNFDLGTSFTNGQSVTSEIFSRIPISFTLGFLSTFISIVIAVPLGTLAAIKRNSLFDYGSTLVSLFGASMPNFWVAMLLTLLFGVTLEWLPVTGTGGPEHWILPAITASLFPITTTMRTTRSSVLEIIRSEYITTARAKGQSEWGIIKKHILRNSMLPVITIVGVSLSASLAGSLIVEVVFTFPGLGLLLSQAIGARNYPIIRGCTIIYAIIVCLVNLLVDIVYAAVDPRIKTQFYRRNKTKDTQGG